MANTHTFKLTTNGKLMYKSTSLPYITDYNSSTEDATLIGVSSSVLRFTDKNVSFDIYTSVDTVILKSADDTTIATYGVGGTGVTSSSLNIVLNPLFPNAAATALTTVLAIGNKTSILGDSIPLGNGVHSATLQYRGNADPLNWAHLLSNGKIYYQLNAGVGGNTSTQILARVTTDIISTGGSDWCVLWSIGTNDALQNVSFTTFKANVIAIITLLRTAGIKVALSNIVPSTDTTAKTLIPKFNAFLAYYAYSNRIPFIDIYSKLADPAGTGGQLAAYNSGDGTHPNAAGGKIMGQALYDCLDTVMGDWKPYASIVQTNSQNLLPNGLNADGNSDGTGDSYVKTGTGTASIVTGDNTIVGNWQRLVVTDGTVSSIYQPATTGFSVGDRLAFSCKIQAAPTTPSKVNVYITFVGPFISHYVLKDVDVSVATALCYYEFTVPATTTAIRATIASSTGGTNADIRFAQVTLVNLTTLGIL